MFLVHNSVPSTPTTPTHGPPSITTHTRASLFRTIYDSLPRIRPRPQRRDTSEGLIAPRSPMLIPASPLHSPTHLHRVPSFTSIPPPMLSPSRRLSADSYAAAPGPAAARHEGSDSSSFRLRPPPRRMASGMEPVTRDPSGGTQAEMRRTTSTFARMESDPALG